MSQLPEHANLEHLKKQAKTLLPELQRQNAEAKLADALHAVARQYGFGSWPQLKEHLDAGLPTDTTAENPFAGVWKANIERSKRHPAHPFESAEVTIAVSDDAYTISQEVIEPSGQPQRSTSVIHVGGEERSSDTG